MTVPSNKLYIRNAASLISQRELDAIKEKQDKIERSALFASQNKEAKKDEGKDKDNQSVKGEKASKKDGKEN